MTTFSRFPPRLQEAIVSRLGWTGLRPVQELAGAAILDGNHALILAPTAGGKTEAAVFPLLARMMDAPGEGLRMLYIAPLKALLNNQHDRLGEYTGMVGLRRFVWHGDVKPGRKEAFKRDPADLLMTTPEALEVMLLSARVPHARLFSSLRYVVIDEIHAFAGTDRGAHLMSVLERVGRHSADDIQRVGLSATVGNPAEILDWMMGGSTGPGVVIDPPREPTPREIRIHLHESIRSMAERAAGLARGRKSLFFCQSRRLTETVADRMRHRGVEVHVHHSSVSAEERAEAEARFSGGTNTAIVCTSTLELGIDVGDLDRVLQANAPATVSAFLQRLGRTGRRPGQRANTTFFCEDPETLLQAIAIVELAREHWVEPVPRNDRCWPVLVHQLFALALEFGAIRPDQCRELLSTVPDFSGITADEFESVVAHLVAHDYLYSTGGRLCLGDAAERIYGRKNFLALYAVFTSPQLYTIKTEAGYVLGTLDQDFVDKLVEEMSSFLLSGRAWTVVHINHVDRTVRVKKAPRGREPSWGGIIPQILGFEICRKVQAILSTDDPIPYIDAPARTHLAALREDLGPLLQGPGPWIQIEPDRALWWTFAGGRTNQTLRYGLELQLDAKIVADNFRVKIEGTGVVSEALPALIHKMARPDFWSDPDHWRRILDALPDYRLSKFQPALPDRYAAEMVGRYLLDVDGVVRVLSG